MSIWDYIKSLQCNDFETFRSLIDANCDVRYVFNGKMQRCTGSEYVNRLQKGHFENTIKSDLKRLFVEKIATPKNVPSECVVYSISDDTIYQRLGLGKDEDGPGSYEMHSDGIITFLNGKIVRMLYAFSKTKRDIEDHSGNIVDLIAVGGANAVKKSANISFQTKN